MKETGVVYLIGAGPGDPGLITEKGLFRLRICDAVVYDSLLSPRLLDEVPDQCRKIHVGKRAGRHSMKQEEINKLLVELAGEGLAVVRLKGGDPFVFGRGGEEIMALSEAGIPYEVVSGVTSAVAALASAGIPVTHRAVSRSFHVMTGHTLSEEGTLPPDFAEFARLSGTLVFLMGLGNLSLIVKGLLNQGKPGLTPAAVIQNGTLPGERTIRGTLTDIEEKVLADGIESPAIIVVGEVASLDFSSTLKQPLEGSRIGVTGTDSFTVRLRKQLESLGGASECILSLSIESHRKGGKMKEAYGKLPSYTWIVFTSANGVREFFHGLLEWGYDFRSVGHVKIAAVGKGTADELQRYGFLADYIPEKYQVQDLAAGLKGMVSGDDRLLIPRSLSGSKVLNEILDETGIPYDDIVLYEVALAGTGTENRAEALKHLDYLTFSSASGVEAFFREADEEIKEALAGLKVVCIGDITAKALMEQGRKADIIAGIYSIQGITEAICRDWKEEKRKN
ncbi:MAG TPA: uroporphyrinogen-III C-methyltransferase [Lachnoclostridium sp.]|uniref:uroporphyrinogen-III C-methyltransferase n=1 Tax=Lacrimispora sp. TaxID=2719234 RepID=UPI000EE9DAF0|nr:uroporphyrinogen-III C-methyltransferase [Lacrimispora sp.]HCD44707.1 uroporphyrinogen-III C-methyltransferase [Lachnoclostridium sp.]